MSQRESKSPLKRYLLLVVVIISIFAFSAAALKVISKTGTLVTNIVSSRAESVDYRLFLNGFLKASDSIAAMGRVSFSWIETWWVTACSERQVHVEFENLTGGAWTGDASGLVCDGESRALTVYA